MMRTKSEKWGGLGRDFKTLSNEEQRGILKAARGLLTIQRAARALAGGKGSGGAGNGERGRNK